MLVLSFQEGADIIALQHCWLASRLPHSSLPLTGRKYTYRSNPLCDVDVPRRLGQLTSKELL